MQHLHWWASEEQTRSGDVQAGGETKEGEKESVGFRRGDHRGNVSELDSNQDRLDEHRHFGH